MPQAKHIEDALWHCLYPRVSLGNRTALTSVIGLTPRRDGRNAKIPLRRCNTQSYPVSFRASRRNPQSQRIGYQREVHGDAGDRPGFFRANKADPPTADPARTYALLRQQAPKGQYKEVQESVHHLVKQCGEAPNGRLYEALILANTDCWHGSASEVARLLHDMVEDGVVPDSPILHSALKVQESRYDCMTAANIPRFSLYIRTTSSGIISLTSCASAG